MKKCKCEHWETCPGCYPQGFDESGTRKPVEIPPTRDEMLERIKNLKAERDELAVQVEKMRKDIQRHCRYINSDYESCCGICGNKLTEEHHPDCSMSLPDISTSILNSVRADALRKAATICNELCEPTLLALAADMEAEKC